MITSTGRIKIAVQVSMVYKKKACVCRALNSVLNLVHRKKGANMGICQCYHSI